MALKDKKITEAGINQHGVVSAPDHLTGTPTENKKVFDRLVRALVAQSVNGLIDDLAGTGGAEEIGVSPINGLSGSNVQELLAAMKALLDKRIAEAGVASFNGRSGLVVPESGDYTAAMVGAAPAGYGLGTRSAKRLSSSDNLDSIIEHGWYDWVDAPINAPTDYGLMRVWSGLGSYTVQEFMQGGGGLGVTRQRTRNGDTWTEWEWVNPRMALGEEYRTTERYLGKPVYAMHANFGINTNGRSVYYAEDVAAVVRGVAHYNGSVDLYPAYFGASLNEWSAMFQFEVKTDPEDGLKKVKATCYAGEKMSGVYGYNTVTIYYTKTTDQ